MNRRDRAIVAGAAAVLFVLVAGGGIVTRPAGAPGVPGLASAPMVEPAAPRASDKASAHASSDLAAQASAPQASSVAAALQEIDPPPGHVQICGLGVFKVPEEAEIAASAPAVLRLQSQMEDWERSQDAAAAALEARLVESLRARGDDWSRMQAFALTDDADGAARMARATTDGRVYGMAWRLCRKPDAAKVPACQQLSAERWSQLDADNVAPWFELAAAAERGKDRSGLEHALHRAALAKRVQFGFGDLSDLVAEPAFVEAGPGAWQQLFVKLIGVDAGLSFPRMSKGCSKDAVLDANRRQTCAALARLLIRDGRSIFDKTIGENYGRAAGLPAEEMDAIQAKRKRAEAASLNAFGEREQMLGCRMIRRGQIWARARARDGEWASLQALADEAAAR